MYNESLRFNKYFLSSVPFYSIFCNCWNGGGRVWFKERYVGQQQRRDNLNDLLSKLLGFSETFSSRHIFLFSSAQDFVCWLFFENVVIVIFFCPLSFKENVPELLESDHGVPVNVGLHHHLLEVVIGEAYPEPSQDKLNLRCWYVPVTILKYFLLLHFQTPIFYLPCQRPWRPVWDRPRSPSHSPSSPSGWQIQRSPQYLSHLCQPPKVIMTKFWILKCKIYIDQFL